MWKWGRLWMLMRRELALAWVLLRDRRVPWAAKAVTVAALLYVLSPVDLVSDLLPVLGWVDDGVVALLLLRLATRLLPGELHAALRAGVERRSAARAARG